MTLRYIGFQASLLVGVGVGVGVGCWPPRSCAATPPRRFAAPPGPAPPRAEVDAAAYFGAAKFSPP
ncbi:hypothetical protein, partial [Micromonospora chalcea]|uniref:hypothetical protein n=1 Tax=Micromonospora chalcea TaxID=1874 RepID=UPI0033208696